MATPNTLTHKALVKRVIVGRETFGHYDVATDKLGVKWQWSRLQSKWINVEWLNRMK